MEIGIVRIPSWFLFGWVGFSIITTIVGGFFAYSQARQRTREVNEIAPIDEGVDVIRIAELLSGISEPEAPDVSDQSNATPVLLIAQPVLTPIPSTPDASVGIATDTNQTPSLQSTEVATPSEITTPQSEPLVPVWSDPRRINVLVLGIDQRQGEIGSFNTDTMILLSLDPVAKTGAILSIPRDLWVAYPAGLGDGKINSANRVGDLRQYPGGGPEMAKQTVGGLLGINVHNYVMINFDAFLTFIDIIGEVEVCPPEPIDDPKYPDGSYGFKPIYIEAGCQSMNGERLLEYARTRATANGDFDRSQRQQEVIFAVQQKILTTGGATSLLRNATTIWDAVKDNVRTDFTLQELIELAALAETIPRDNIRNAAIGPGEVEFGTAQGEDILIPITSDILLVVTDLFRPPNTPPQYLPE